MSKYTLSFGLLPPELDSDTKHLLPVSSIVDLESTVLTTGRDGNVIIEESQTKLAVHSDWISGIACLSATKFLTVSHDFTICYNWKTINWNHRIVGYHDDYVKGISLLGLDEMKCKFATVGLDKKLKIWELDLFEVENEEDIEAKLLGEFDNTTLQDAGSIYCLISVKNLVIFGDNEGRLRWYDVNSNSMIRSIDDAASVNLKTLKLLDDDRTFLSTSADGEIKLWDVETGKYIWGKQLLNAVWSVEGHSSKNLFLGDSIGNIMQIQGGQYSFMYKPGGTNTQSGGVLAMSIIDNVLWFSRSGSSDLNKLNLLTKELTVIEGGHALLRCSLLTNRRHVITENTLGDLEKWDIVSCELVEVINRDEGTFDEVVRKKNPKEVLPHWCSVSIKRGILFVKINERFLNTEVYGSALNDYEIVNADKAEELNLDERYNLGRIAVNSLLHEFINYELIKDKKFREDKTNPKKQTPPSTPNILRRQNSMASEHTISDQHKDSKNVKEKRRLSIFTKFTQSNNTTPQSSAPNTPNGIPDGPANHHGIIEENEDDMEMMLPDPATALSGPLKPATIMLTRTVTDQSLERSATPSSTFGFHNRSSRIKLDTNSMDETLSVSSTGNGEMKFKFSSKSFSKDSNQPGLFLNEYIEEVYQTYLKQAPNSSSSFMKFGKRTPETLFVRDSTRPVVKIKSGCILTVNHWKEGSTGETLAFSTYLPPPTYTSNDLIENYHTFESLERHLPIWLGKILFKEDKVIKNYPKITFIIQPWKDTTLLPIPSSSADSEKQANEHKKSPFHRKTKPPESPLILPKINDTNVRLTASSMIKAKKIKHYIVDRFESKTPEMKNKEDPSEWLEILCKGTVLENDLTLSTIRTLYWKSNTDIMLEYRRKPTQETLQS
ncbi:unnamed protein product [Kluyveromyces dobzhanskii CBS 2104]|uniref:WGS project CCBQ000000000 data, contig 00058 n=1 Tax=Kluyveromyces dobzhanskii CBS 2104 TaxID=1427455 RepID=A0A0A8LDK1_9SACH|nr:unnamed protein product [Kluyveromyces dobzhanskii CBS 2104]